MRYSDEVRDHFFRPRNAGTLAQPTHAGTAGVPGKGPFMVFQLQVDEGRIRAAAFRTYGCPPAIAAGSALTEHVTGLTTEEAARVSEEQLMRLLGGLPPAKRHCAELAVMGLQRALHSTQGSGA